MWRKIWLTFDQFDDTYCAPLIYIQRFQTDETTGKRTLITAHHYKATKNNTWRILCCKKQPDDEVVYH